MEEAGAFDVSEARQNSKSPSCPKSLSGMPRTPITRACEDEWLQEYGKGVGQLLNKPVLFGESATAVVQST